MNRACFPLLASISELWTSFLSKDAPRWAQFLKYVICGGLATVVHQGIWFLLSWKVLPAFDGAKYKGELVTDRVRARHSAINNGIAFFFSNLVAYVTNIIFVFEEGRHGPVVQFLLFTAVSLLSFVIALVAGPVLIRRFGIPTWLSQISFLITSVIVNFIARKYLVFAG